MRMEMGRGMMGTNTAAADFEKKLKKLTRTDFLLQFVWIPVKPADQPQTKEDLDAKLTAELAKLQGAEKTYTPDTSEKMEEQIEAKSLQTSQAVDAAFSETVIQ